MQSHRRRKNRHRRRKLATERLEVRTLLHAAGILNGSVYFDADGDGTRDNSEVGVPGVVVSLVDAAATTNRRALTDDNGNYSFNELEPGTYTIDKRQSAATLDGADSSSFAGASAGDNAISNVVLEDDAVINGVDFAEVGLRSEFISIEWFLASSPPIVEMLREAIAMSEESAGDTALAAEIRSGAGTGSTDTNSPPVAAGDSFSLDEDTVLNVTAANGVLANDTDADNDTLSAALVTQAQNGFVSLAANGSFTYTPNADFSGTDTFTYRARDAALTSNLAAVTITVNPVDDGTGTNESPVATNDAYSVDEDSVLSIPVATGVLANDTDPEGDTLTASLTGQPTNGSVALNANGSLTYTPNADFFGQDSFTYRANDGANTSNEATVQITVNSVDEPNELFGQVTTGSFEDSALLGIRTDLVAGAPALSANHINGDIDYTGYSNPPTYGDHHGFDPNGTDVNPGITPRPTGVYSTEQPDEDLIHNLEHGHVWISYNPSLISSTDLASLEALVRDGSTDANGGGVGVILTPRAANDQAIALASWARLLTLDAYDADTIRNFVETNRGHAPEGFITP